jgi:4-amino-4-deoxy-L-arabinose transferase-like glycosyltransferase
LKFLQGQPAALLALWLVLVVISLFSRSYIPIDETRYVTVAWNMWLRGDYLVPWLNGAAYSHKPPLLFWLMNAGWAVFGVNDWWPRLVPSLFALASVFLTIRLAHRLWPREAQVADLAPLILLGSALWMVFTTATMFDMMIACFTLLGVLGVVIAWQGELRKGWLVVGVAIGLGLLAKGPTILLQVLPVALFAPWWGRGQQVAWSRWYAGMLGAVLLGAAIALLWAIPAGMRGGEDYRKAIFWGQTAERMVNSFAHKRPLWWYLPLLPVILFPWVLWLPVWRGLFRLRGEGGMGVRLCLAWLLPVFLAFSFISGKQMHYLLPIFPAFALLAARGLLHEESRRFDQLPAALAAIAIGVLLIGLPHYAQSHQMAHWIQSIPVWTGAAVILAGLALAAMPSATLQANVWRMTLFSAATVVLTIYIALIRTAGPAYDVREMGKRLKAYQDAGVPLAHADEYPGQYQFVGRMVSEPEIVRKSRLTDWFKAHPEGKAVVYFDADEPLDGVPLDYRQPYLNQQVVILGRDAWPVPKPHAL